MRGASRRPLERGGTRGIPGSGASGLLPLCSNTKTQVFFGWGCCNAVASRRHLLPESRECFPAPGGAAMPRALELRCFCCSSAFKSKFNGIASLSQSITKTLFQQALLLASACACWDAASNRAEACSDCIRHCATHTTLPPASNHLHPVCEHDS